MAQPDIHTALNRLCARHPRFRVTTPAAASVSKMAPQRSAHDSQCEQGDSGNENRAAGGDKKLHDDATPGLTIASLIFAEEDQLRASIAATSEQFDLTSRADAAHLWWYSFLTAIASTPIWLGIQEHVWSDCRGEHLIPQGGMWWQALPRAVLSPENDHDPAVFALTLVADVEPLLCWMTDHTELKAAPAWALLMDVVGIAAIEAGNDDFDPDYGEEVARALQSAVREAACARGIRLPETQVDELAPADPWDEPVKAIRRVGCCMVYRSPKAGICGTCPRARSQSKRA